MSPTARTVLPTDLVALVSYDGHVYSNQAMTLDRVGTEDSPSPLETAFENWFSFATGRHTWISVKGPTLRGLASARKRGSKLAWEIDCLINAEDRDPGVVMSLLDQVTEAAGKSGALKIFLRVPAASEVAAAATKCGFAAYQHEAAYRAATAAIGPAPALPEGLRRRTKADLYATFQLYNASVPEGVRRYEAQTLAEWIAAQEHMGRAAQYVLDGDGGGLRGWLRIAGDGDAGRFDLLAENDALDALLDAAIAKLSNRETIDALVPAYRESLQMRLEERGFERGEEYIVLSRRTVRPVKATSAVPVIAQTTTG